MGCYGIGVSRAMGAIVEVHNDKKGIKWPVAISPYQVHLIHPGCGRMDSSEVYDKLVEAGVDVLYDDRQDISAGEKFADVDLIGIPIRLVVSEKIPDEKVEWKERNKDKAEIVSISDAVKRVKREF